MRATVLITVSALALGLGACSPKQAAAPAATGPSAPALTVEKMPTLPAASAPAPEAPPASATSPETTAATPAAAPAGPTVEAPYRFSPGDFARRERTIAALIANAESRDTLGLTAGVATQGRRARERCATRRCVEAAYAVEEAKLRRWEGSSEIR
jgi:hypothetical protein